MYADNPRSRIAREFFYILNAMKDHYKALLRMSEDEPPRLGPMLILMAIYMLREEGRKYIRPLDIVHETQLPRSSVYRILNDMADEQILQNNLGEFMCLSRTPDFLLNPEELYGREIPVVGDTDYKREEEIRESMEVMVQKAVSEELAKRQPPTFAPPGIGVGGLEDMKREVDNLPLYPIAMTATPPMKPQKKKKEGKEKEEEDIEVELENEIEEEYGDFFL